MHNIRTIIAFAFHHIALGPEHFLRRAELHRNAANLAGDGMRKPRLIDLGNTIARAKDHVDTAFAAHGLAEPMGEGELGVIPGGAEHL